MMITIGITGGVGAGKSTVLDFLEEKYLVRPRLEIYLEHQIPQ